MTRCVLAWPVPTPQGPAMLSAGQRVTQSVLWSEWLRAGRRPFLVTVRGLAARTGASSPGRQWEQLARLRSLGVVAWQATRGRRGGVRVWFGSGLRRGIVTGAMRRRELASRNVPASPSGITYTTREGAAARWRSATESGGPPGSAGRGGFAGPRRGQRPPRVLYGRCPAGHPVRSGRWSWRGAGRELVAEYRGWCRRCSRPVLEHLEIRAPEPPAEMFRVSLAELADPALAARRARLAAELVAYGGRAAELIRRDYADAVRPPEGSRPL